MKPYVQYSEEIANEICETLATSTKGIKRLCEENSHFPAVANVYKWIIAHPEFRDNYARAKALQIECLVDEALERAFDASRDTYQDEKGNDRCDHEWVQRSRLVVDTIKWLSSKLAPKIYGDKIHIEKNDPSADEDLVRAKLIAAQLQGDDNGRSDEPKS